MNRKNKKIVYLDNGEEAELIVKYRIDGRKGYVVRVFDEEDECYEDRIVSFLGDNEDLEKLILKIIGEVKGRLKK